MQVTPAHGSTQFPVWQTCPLGQMAEPHFGTQVPLLQYDPAAQFTPTQALVKQRLSEPHMNPVAQRLQSQLS